MSDYTSDWMRENRATLQAEDWQDIASFLACHAHQTHITEDDAADLAEWAVANRPDAIRRKDQSCATTPTRTRVPVSSRPSAVHALTTRRGRFSGWWSCRRSTSASRFSAGRSDRSSGNGWANAAGVALIVALMVAARRIGGA